MKNSDLQFDEGTHTYRLMGRVLPSVTTVIRAVMPGWRVDPWYLQRGRAIHHGCRLLDEGQLDWASVAPEIAQRIKAWQEFVSECYDEHKKPPVMSLIEAPLCSTRYMFAGTLDRVFNEDTIIDLKSTITPEVRIQLGGYSILLKENYPEKMLNAVAVQLQDDGKYQIMMMSAADLRRAEQIFLATLTVFNFIAAHKLKGNPDNGRPIDPSSC